MLGEDSEVRDIRFEQMLLLDEETPVGAVATVEGPGVVTSWWTPSRTGNTRDAPPRSCTLSRTSNFALRTTWPHCWRHIRAALKGIRFGSWMAKRGIRFGPAFTGLTAAYTSEGSGATVLAEVALPASIRSQQIGYGVHPALLDACFQSVAAHPSVGEVANGGMLSAAGRPSATRLRSHPQRAVLLFAGDRSRCRGRRGRPRRPRRARAQSCLLSVACKMGTGVSEASERDRVLGERLLTIDWQHRELPEVADAHPGAWLLISTSATADAVATKLADALKVSGAQCTPMSWPQHADHQHNAERLRDHLATDGFDGVVVVTGPRNGSLDDELAVRGGEYVRHLVRIVRELPKLTGEPPPVPRDQ